VPETEEAYCVDSGRPVSPQGGDRCKSHGGRGVPCFVAFRAPRCTHPDWPRWANGSNRCPECRAEVHPTTTEPEGGER
jgi:hypothetical protein